MGRYSDQEELNKEQRQSAADVRNQDRGGALNLLVNDLSSPYPVWDTVKQYANAIGLDDPRAKLALALADYESDRTKLRNFLLSTDIAEEKPAIRSQIAKWLMDFCPPALFEQLKAFDRANELEMDIEGFKEIAAKRRHDYSLEDPYVYLCYNEFDFDTKEKRTELLKLVERIEKRTERRCFVRCRNLDPLVHDKRSYLCSRVDLSECFIIILGADHSPQADEISAAIARKETGRYLYVKSFKLVDKIKTSDGERLSTLLSGATPVPFSDKSNLDEFLTAIEKKKQTAVIKTPTSVDSPNIYQASEEMVLSSATTELVEEPGRKYDLIKRLVLHAGVNKIDPVIGLRLPQLEDITIPCHLLLGGKKNNAGFKATFRKGEMKSVTIVGDGQHASIPEFAFSNMKLDRVVIGNCVKEISDKAFYKADIRNIVFLADEPFKPSKGKFSSFKDIFKFADIREVHIKFKQVPSYAFAGVDRVTAFHLNSVELVGEGAFYGTYLPHLEATESILSIGKEAFAESHLIAINLPNLREMGERAFSCSSVNRFEAGALAEVDKESFKDCIRLSQVELPHLKSLGDRAFENCRYIGEITLNADFRTGGCDVFKGCDNIIVKELFRTGDVKLDRNFHRGLRPEQIDRGDK